MERTLVAVLFLGSVVMGCDDGSAPSTCVPGAIMSCPCGDGSTSTQICLPSGVFDPCDCPTECNQNTDCPASRPICTPALICAECRNDSDCPPGKPFCDEDAGTCQVDDGTGGTGGGGGTGGAEGGSGGTGGGGGNGGSGGSGSLSCLPGETVSCSCGDGSTGTQTCLSNGTFGTCECTAECKGNTDCPIGRPFCIDGVCRECAAHPDCPASRPYCTPALTCAECRFSSDCPHDRPFCDEDGTCIECSTNTDCPAPEPICNVDAGTCHVCLVNNDCPAERPRCSSATGCVECLDSVDCPAARPYCSVEATCVECLGSGDCNAGTCVDGVCNPCVLISPSDLDLGTVEPGCSSSTREVRIINICDASFVVDEIELSSATSGEFSVAKVPTPGVTLPAGGRASFTMAYRPADEGPDLGSVLVYVREATGPFAAVVRGRGAIGATQIDTFTQNVRQKVDILWVMDNSGSMGEEQGTLADNLESFLSFAISEQVDFQIGVTTTGLSPVSGIGGISCPGGADGGEDGRLFPVDGSQPRIVTRSTPNMAQVWANNFRVGICHSDEQPLEAAYRALTPPVIDRGDDPRHPEPNDGNLGFLREDAHLAIIAVTDESDSSASSVDFYCREFRSIKGFQNPHLFGFHAITGDRNTGCSGDNSAMPGDRLIELVERTDGVFQSICAPDWVKSLKAISLAAFGYKDCFHLGNVPKEISTLFVKVDGRSSPSGAAWSYSATRNAVCFNVLAVPESGAEIEIGYRVACGSGG